MDNASFVFRVGERGLGEPPSPLPRIMVYKGFPRVPIVFF